MMSRPDGTGSSSDQQGGDTAQRPSDLGTTGQAQAAVAPAGLLNQNMLVRNMPGPAGNGLPLIYQGQNLSFPIALGGGLGIPNQAYSSQFGGQFVGGMGGIPGAQLISQTAVVPFTFPVTALNPLNQNMAILGNQMNVPFPGGGVASTPAVENALATIAAARAPLPESVSEPGKLLPDGSHPSIVVFMECDEESLSDYQCLLRKQVELFEATADDVQWNAQGRNKAIVMGQVGIRCRYCARLPTWSRSRGAVYYSASLDGLYQAAQNMAKNHLCRHCRLIPEDVRKKLLGLRECKRRAAGGKKYWAEGARVLGVYQESDGLRFRGSLTGRNKQTKENESGD